MALTVFTASVAVHSWDGHGTLDLDSREAIAVVRDLNLPAQRRKLAAGTLRRTAVECVEQLRELQLEEGPVGEEAVAALEHIRASLVH